MSTRSSNELVWCVAGEPIDFGDGSGPGTLMEHAERAAAGMRPGPDGRKPDATDITRAALVAYFKHRVRTANSRPKRGG
jgi:hypothetical protein